MLEGLALLGAAGLGRQERRHPGEHGEHGRRRAGLGPHGGAVAAQEQDLGGLARLVGVLPHPRASAVRGAESSLHRGA